MLQKFDLGMVPASVTPPRTWRRAGWFAVLSSAATLGGIVLATAALAPKEPPHHTAEVPHMPRGHDYPRPAALSDPSALGRCVPGPPRRTRGSSEPSPAETTTSPESTNLRALSPRSGDPNSPPGEGSAPHSAESGSRAPEPRPERQVPTSTGSASSLPTTSESVTALAEQQYAGTTSWSRMRELTERYFSDIAAGELRNAHGMTGGRLRRADFAEFAAPYADADRIEVVATTAAVDSTVTELRLERSGGTRTLHRRLRFDEERHRVVADVPAS